MTHLASEVIERLRGRTLATAESCTGGMIGVMLTAVPGSSAVYKGGIISYCNEVKHTALGVEETLLQTLGPVSRPVAEAMAVGAVKAIGADVAVSVTGLAGPGGDEYGNPVGTVYIGYADRKKTCVKHCLFTGDREAVRRQAAEAALRLILEQNA